MVKADLAHDYYADLDLAADASTDDIKKAYKKLSLKYHPDRNIGREAEATTRFQLVQAAYEILNDVEQKRKYDSGRRVGGGGFARQPAGSSGFGGTASGARNQKGNPYSGAGNFWPPPPKPPPVRKTQPPPSSGADRYNFFQTPSAKAKQDAEAKRKAQAFESMRNSQPRPQPPPPPRESRPLYGEYASAPSPQRSPSRHAPDVPPRKSAYTPGMSGGDNPQAANNSSYFRTQRAGRAPTAPRPPPDLPSRAQPPVDPLRLFREQANPTYEPRISTPYATAGGEKTDPFESLNLNRTKSNRERDASASANAGPFPPGGSDRHRSASPPRTRYHRPHEDSKTSGADNDFETPDSPPKRTFSYANHVGNTGGPSRTQSRYKPGSEPGAGSGTSSDGEGAANDMRQPFGNRPRKPLRTRTRAGQHAADPHTTARPSFGTEMNGQTSDGIPLGRTSSSRGADTSAKPDPSMYAAESTFTPSFIKASTFPQGSTKSCGPFPHFLGTPHLKPSGNVEYSTERWPNLFPPKVRNLSDSPSGDSPHTPRSLNAFEAAQFEMLDELVGRKPSNAVSNSGCRSQPRSGADIVRRARHRLVEAERQFDAAQPISPGKEDELLETTRRKYLRCSRNSSSALPPITELGSPYKKPKFGTVSGVGFGHAEQEARASTKPTVQALSQFKYAPKHTVFNYANPYGASSFSFKVGDETFTARSAGHKPFKTNSAENISTTFTPEDWHGKFEAGDDFFGKDSSTGQSRGSSSSRTRGRSPVKPRAGANRPRAETRPSYANIDPDILIDERATATPGGTKFSAEEWASTFKPQTFAPPPFASPTSRPSQSSRVPSRKSRMGSSSNKSHVHRTATGSAMIDSDDSSDEPLYMGNRPNPATAPLGAVPNGFAGSPTAMDIDPPLAAARNVPVEPSRPDWRAGDANGVKAQSDSSAPTADKKAKRATKSTDSEDFRTNFDDLKNVEPLANPATGLESFGDLSTTLPFPSRASNTPPISRGFAGELELPNPPIGPKAPTIPEGASRPSMSSWESYMVVFKAYMAEWEIFNTRMLMHFVERKNQVDHMPPGWIEAFGEKSIEEYKTGLKEDERVITHWDLARSKHYTAVEDFVSFRTAIKNGVGQAGPPPRMTVR